MTDQIFRIASEALQTTDEQTRLMFQRVINSQTPGYKKPQVAVNSFQSTLDQASTKLDNAALAPKIARTFNDFSKGSYQKTASPTHVAIGGDGFFMLQGQQGELYTRDGRFWVDQNGRMLSVSGDMPVLGYNGPVVVLPGSKIEISQTGVVKADGVEVDKLLVALFENKNIPRLRTANNVLFSQPESGDVQFVNDENPRLLPGFIETSNASMVEEMMNMVTLSRMQGMDAKLVSNRDAMLSRALEIGRPSQ